MRQSDTNLDTSFCGLLAAIRAASEQFSTRVPPLLRAASEFSSRLGVRLAQINDRVEQVRPELVAVFSAVHKRLQTLPEECQHALAVLARHGWFLDPSMGFTRVLALSKAFETDDPRDGHQLLIDYYAREISRISADLASTAPDRIHILRQALAAHIAGQFALSVPVFLAQADGICSARVGCHLYSRRNGTPVLAALFNDLPEESLLGYIMYPLALPLPLTASSAERAGLPTHLNRHAILHGESLDYDSALVSAQALSLVHYVAHACGQNSTT
jgi:hypothetical protein